MDSAEFQRPKNLQARTSIASFQELDEKSKKIKDDLKAYIDEIY